MAEAEEKDAGRLPANVRRDLQRKATADLSAALERTLQLMDHPDDVAELLVAAAVAATAEAAAALAVRHPELDKPAAFSMVVLKIFTTCGIMTDDEVRQGFAAKKSAAKGGDHG